MKNLTEEQYREVAEFATYKDLLQKFPTGILSLVSDTYDIWNVITKFLPKLKEEILAREGKLVIRPDSGDPVDIICGLEIPIIDIKNAPDYETFLKYAEESMHEELVEETPHGEYGGELVSKYFWNGDLYKVKYAPNWDRHDKQYYYIENFGNNISAKEIESKPEDKGVIELLWDVFGGTINEQGYKVLDSHIGAIYGDSINLDRAKRIFERLAVKEFATSNIVLGIGSYSLQMVTRDTHGFAQKATYIEIGEGIGVEIFKDPITDDGTKKSAKGLLRVNLVDGVYILQDQCTKEEEKGGELKVIYEDGKFYNQVDFETIRKRIDETI